MSVRTRNDKSLNFWFQIEGHFDTSAVGGSVSRDLAVTHDLVWGLEMLTLTTPATARILIDADNNCVTQQGDWARACNISRSYGFLQADQYRLLAVIWR